MGNTMRRRTVHAGYCGAARFATAFVGAGDTAARLGVSVVVRSWTAFVWREGLRTPGWIDGNLMQMIRFAQSQESPAKLAAWTLALSADLPHRLCHKYP